jgi:uncharacterized protein (DUF362 family)
MSFLIDPPLLFLSGLAIYFLGIKLEWNRHAKIVIGIAIAMIFIIFSSLLYADIIRCTFPFFSGLKGSEFMFHSNYTGITKSMVPAIVVALLFLLYPIWIFAGYSLALLLHKRKQISKEVYSYSDVKSKVKASPSTFAVSRGPNSRQCMREAINAIGGIGKFVKNGDRVLVKVNICGGVPEIEGSFTSIEIVDELVDLIKSVGGEPLVADADMIWIKFWRNATDMGWVDWAKKKGVQLLNLSDTKIVGFNFGEDSALCLEKVSIEAINANVIISVPAMKTHLLTGVTLAMKNMYGTFPDVDKAKFHRKGIEQTIYEVNKAFTPNLVIIDGSIGGEAIGPLSCKPVVFETIVASNDVVTADSIACQLMGYDPMDIVHIKMAHEQSLGDASAKFDLEMLPYKHPGGKDGNWNRPDPKVKDFYEWAIELLLKLPGWETLFNIGADFFLYDLARLPVLRYLTPAILQLLNDAVYLNIRGFKNTEQDIERRRINIRLVILVALASIVGFYLDGYLWRSTLLFELSFLAAIAFSIVAAARMKTLHLVGLLVFAAIVSYFVEHTNTSAGMLAYSGSADASPIIFTGWTFFAVEWTFIVTGWMLMMVVILQIADLMVKWISALGIFQKLQWWSNLPFVLALILFIIFMSWEGYLSMAGREVLIMYAIMAAIGLLYSTKHSIEWNASLMVVAIIVGGYMELVGSMAGFWQYSFKEPLAVFIVLSWPINSWTVHGLAYLVGIDLGTHKERSLLPPKAN